MKRLFRISSASLTSGFTLVLISLLWLAGNGHAQAPALMSMSPAAFSIEGNHPQIASLDGLWRFHSGDDPRWADPAFDDSQWPLLRSDRPWNLQGYPSHFGYAWYRFKFEVSDGAKPVALLMPEIGSGYQIFENGELVGTAGETGPSRDPLFGVWETVFQLRPVGDGPRTIQFAVRVWADKPIAVWAGAGPRSSGGAVGDPKVLSQLLDAYQNDWALKFVNEYAYGLLALVVGLTTFGLFRFHPADREYLWFSILLLAQASGASLHILLNLGSLPFPLWRLLDLIAGASSVIAALNFFSIVLRARRSAPLRVAWAMVAASPLSAALFYFQWTSVGLSFAIAQLCLLPAYVWIIAMLWICAVRKDVVARLLLVPAVLFYGVDLSVYILRITYQLTGNSSFSSLDFYLARQPFPLGLEDLAGFIFILALLIFLVRRFSLARQEETRLSNEIEAARSIQSLLFPAAAPNTPRFAVHSVYLPANEVGGDFFQILPQADDESLLIVAGDVTGKGLHAGMLVALLVGTIRTVAEETTEPLKILQALNRRLLGREDAKATCLALHIAADGDATLANAGHLPPYLNGQPMEMEGALPLGMIEKADFSVQRFNLSKEDRLVFMSDGVAEATNAKRELFGFERVNEVLRNARSAADVACAAQAFGQEDDISVIFVTRTGK